MSAFEIFRTDGEQTSEETLEHWLTKTAPPWRQPGEDVVPANRTAPSKDEHSWQARGESYVSRPDGLEAERINIALLLRRPLLVTGTPGLGKSSLAYAIAWRLGLGCPLRWEISSRSTLEEALYTYDAVEHLRAAQATETGRELKLGQFVRLGPLGTALLPSTRPRVLLVDELDKASYDLPNDLLHVFEEAAFSIPELLRQGGSDDAYPWDAQGHEDVVTVRSGWVRAYHHPVVLITSNGEREFPSAFLRRCVRLDLPSPTPEHLTSIVDRQLGSAIPKPERLTELLERYSGQPTDAILQALFLDGHGISPDAAEEALRRS